LTTYTKRISAQILLSLSALSTLAAQNTDRHRDGAMKVYVGIIEDDRQQLARLGPKDLGPVKNRVITVAFERNSSGWGEAKPISTSMKWTVVFDGKEIGAVVSEPQPSSEKSETGFPSPLNTQSILTQADKIPTVGKPDGKFNGNFETVVRRPLVVVSEANFADPDGWKRGNLPDGIMESVRSSFRHTFQHLRQCDSAGEPLKTEWSPSDSEIVLSKAYKSNKGSFIAETHIKDNRCAFNQNGSHFQSVAGNQWFYVGADSQPAHLGDDWQLLDSGDYDRDGKSEVIFYVAEGSGDSVETEGYVLFYDDFRSSVRFSWRDR
jgi:hypothetical protein